MEHPFAAAPAQREVAIGPYGLPGTLRLPERARGLVIFAHGSGSSRFSPRNIHVADVLAGHGLASLLFDLLTADEAEDRDNVFDIPLLGDRLVQAIEHAALDPAAAGLPVGLFGASTGAAAALCAAAQRPEAIACVVSRGGRPDLAGDALPKVKAPTLLIVGGRDLAVLALNREAAHRLRCRCKLEVVPGASHLFEEPGTLDAAAALAAAWFVEHLPPPPA